MHTVLIVDDEPAVVEALIAQLMPIGAWLEGAYNAEEALKLLEAQPSVIIADYLMPGMRGDDFLIQAHRILPDARLILLTGQAGAENVGKVINHARLFRYIAKPWEPEDLRITVQQALQSYETEIQLREGTHLTEKLVAFLQALIETSSAEELTTLSQRWSEIIFGVVHAPEAPLAPENLSPAAQKAWVIFSRTHRLQRAHLQLLEELEAQVQSRTAHLVAALQESKALASQREAWLQILSHDLRGPLSGLRQLSQILSHDKENLPRYINLMQNTLAELEKYTNNLLELSRLSHKEMALRKEPFSWPEMAKRLHALIAPQLELKRIRWQEEIPNTQGWGDSTYATEALFNILNNAVKFTPEGGQVGFRVFSQGHEDQIEITDTGIGMDEETLKSLWDPTRRRSRLGTMGERGTGLGLPLAHAILTQHGVRIEVQSAIGKGTTFRLYWPKA
ncbi:MAG: hybrid sensor histidine kinase/response regulator [Bacteroidia bacterium]|nr:hybrid sensor histidine kinase/response regulator [Bacteroidia bacterium]MDW8235398.1 hybrid sensor histidine kinase/response regulator [Bacteroidia bacterium]